MKPNGPKPKAEGGGIRATLNEVKIWRVLGEFEGKHSFPPPLAFVKDKVNVLHERVGLDKHRLSFTGPGDQFKRSFN